MTQLKKDAQVIIDESGIEIERCQEEITSLSYAIANLEIEHEIGKVDEENYKMAFALLQDTLRRATTEKTDYELTKSKLSSVLLGDQSSNLRRNPTKSTLNKSPTQQQNFQSHQWLFTLKK